MMRRIISLMVAVVITIAMVTTGSMQAYADTSASQEQAESTAPIDVTTELKATYTCAWNGQGWDAAWTSDNRNLIKAGSYPTAISLGLSGQPSGMSGTIVYQVNLSGSGWLDQVENAAQIGAADGNMPLESIKVWLSGDLSKNYDIYTKVLVAGSWTGWFKNGESAGTEGIGTHIDGFRISITAKDAGEPADIAQGTIDPTRPMVALTFDDGPNASVTNRILTALEAVGGHATFFMVGNRVHGDNAACVARMVAGGSEVGNHTFTHVYLTKLSASGVQDTINQTNAVIQAACGVTPVVVRPPGGYHNAASDAALGSVGEASVMWSIDTLDWKTRNTQSTINSVLGNVKDGDIVLMHDLYEATGAAAETIIPELVARGYQLVTVSELAAARGGLQPGQVCYSFH